jgi:putative ABC transport system permease protein
MNLVTLSWKNLTIKPWMTLLSLVLFALGVGLISLLFLLEHQLQEKFEKNLAGIDLVVGAKGSPLQLILSSMYHIDAPTGNISLKEARSFLNPKHPLIEKAIPLSMGDSYRAYRIVGTTQDFIDLYEAEIATGKIWEQNFDVTIGHGVALDLGLDIGDRFKSSHGLMDDEDFAHDEAESFIVVGILKPSGSVIDQLILCTPQSFWLVHDHGEGQDTERSAPNEGTDQHHDDRHPATLLEEDPERQITSLLLTFKGHSYQALNMQRNINVNTEMQAATPAIEINRLFNLMDAGEQTLRILAMVIIFVSGLSVFISLYSSLRDRRYELALMRVSGGTPAQLFLLIIMEGLILAIVGYGVGMLLSHGGMQIFAGVMKTSYRYSFSGLQFLPCEWFLLFGALGIGFVAAVIPAIQASRTDISETLAEGK